MTSNDTRKTLCSKLSQRTSENMTSIEPSREISEQEEGPYCSAIARFFRTHCNAILKSKLPIYLFMSIYVFICLLGNVVTGIIWFEHHRTIDSEKDDRHSINNTTMFEFDWNETIIPGPSLEFDTDGYEEEVANLIGLTTNESKTEVSSPLDM